jgi:hypothetical protein
MRKIRLEPKFLVQQIQAKVCAKNYEHENL